MKKLTAYINASQIITLSGGVRRGKSMNDLCPLDGKKNTVVTRGELIEFVGLYEEAQKLFKFDEVVDCNGNVLMPAFIDSHTHIVFGGHREEEFNLRLQGVSYAEIMNKGGGINSTMTATRKYSQQALVKQASILLQECMHYGVGTIESKSGYGLDIETEITQLKVNESLRQLSPLDIVSTYMGAHATPPEYKGDSDKYTDFIVNVALPEIHKYKSDNQDFVTFCDVFCENNVFSHEQTKRILLKATELEFKTKIHADEMMNMESTALGVNLNCTSVDHLLYASDNGIDKLSCSNTVATLLPLTAFSLKEHYAPARKMIDNNCIVALATDLNPGSCYSNSLPLLIALSTIYMKMTINEVISALTINGAYALNLTDRGSLEKGKLADMIILDCDNINYLTYHFGHNFTKHLIKRGKRVF